MLKKLNILRFIALCLLGFVMCIPFVWMVATSFKPRAEAQSVALVAQKPTLKNYPVVLDLAPDNKGDMLNMNFGRWYFNSVFISLGITLLQVLTSAMAAYAFSRIHWKGRDTVFLLYLSTLMIPGVVTMIPNFSIMVKLGFLDSYHGLVIPAAFSAFGTFLLRQFMISIPSSLDEAAKLDGAGHWMIFWDIVLPLARSGLIALAILTFLDAYQSFFWPLIMLTNKELYPMALGMLQLDTEYGPQTELIMAATVMNIIPMIITFVIFQKTMVEGIQVGGVKG